MYDLIPLHEPEMLRSWRADHRFTYRWYLRQLRQADRLVAISKTTAEDVADRLDVPPERIDVVYPAVRVPIFTARSPADRPTFLFVGAQDPHKQADLALEAFARFRARTGDGMMRFIGPASDAQARALRRMAIDLGVGESVQIEGRVSDAELDRAYLQATALLWTSRLEGFGLPPIEAIFRGLPVIAVDTTAARETLGDAARFVPSEVEAVVAAMEVPLVPNATTVAALRDRYSVAAASQALRASYAKAGR